MLKVARFAVASLVLATAIAPLAARADSIEGQPPPLVWSPKWPRFRSWEYAGTLALGGTALALQFAAAPPTQPRFTGGILFDDFARGHLRASTPGGRAKAGRVSDLFWWGGSAVPLLLDVPIALLAHQNPEVAGQLALMNLEAFAVAGLINRVFELELGRGRPGRDRCGGPDASEYSCGKPDGAVGMPSGHTLITATAAGLTCVHHRYLPLWGSPAADVSACAILVVATAATGTARLVADRHYVSDVLIGAAIGFGVGYGTPWLLHYRHGASEEHESVRAVLLPMVDGRTVGAAAVGTF